MTLKHILNSITAIIILTLAVYHLFIYFGRKQESYYLIFALMGLASAGQILSITFISDTFRSEHIKLAAFLLQFFRTLTIVLIIVVVKNILEFNHIGNIVNNTMIVIGTISMIVCTIAILFNVSFYYKIIAYPNLAIIVLMGFIAIVNTISGYYFTTNKTTILLLIVIAFVIYGFNGIFSGIATYTKIEFFKFFKFNYILTGLFYLLFALSLALKFNGEYHLLQIKSNELFVLNEKLEQKVVERTAELKTAKDTIEQQERLKTVFFTQLMHHLKTPLSNIRTVIQNERYNDDQSIKVARLNAYELYIQMDNYLVVEKYKNHGEYNYKHDSVVNISSLLNRVVECFSIYNIAANIAPNLNVLINGDSFVRLVSCLLDNAVKYNRVGVNIEVELKASNEQAILTVKDDGVGITESVQANIFNPFYQLANKESNSQGIGMGLNVVKLTVDSAGGDVRVDSKEGKGASFICSFPLSSENVSNSTTVTIDIEAGSDKDIDVSDSAYLNERDNILIVEDNRSLIYTLKEILNEYNVFVALNGAEGLKRLEDLTAEGRHINLILSDEMMDEMSGFEFVEKVRENELLNAIPFVFLTARTEFDDLLKGVRAGAVDYIRKPFEQEEVRARVKRHIEHTFTVVDSYANDARKVEYDKLEKVTIKYGLSGRQRTYAIYSAMGLETKEILAELNEEVNSKNINRIDSALRKVYQKLGVDDRQAMNKLLLDSKGDIT